MSPTYNRQAFLRTAAGLAIAPYAGVEARASDDPAPASRRIDVHHHFLTRRFLEEGATHRAFPASSRAWTASRSLEELDRADVGVAFLSVPTPGVYFGDLAAARSLARACNDEGADLVRRYPKRFRLLATLPLPDIPSSETELAYVLDELGGSGVALFSSYDRRWLGDPYFAPLFSELDRRAAIVFVHPILNGCCDHLLPTIPDTIVEYQTDTTRTIASFIFSGTTVRYPRIRFIFSHGGGTMPYLIERFTEYAKTPEIAERLPNGVLHELTACYYDTAWSTNNAAMRALLSIVPSQRVLFGSDYPALTPKFQYDALAQGAVPKDVLTAILGGNANRLLIGGDGLRQP